MLMVTHTDDPTLIQHKDQITVFDRADALCHRDDRRFGHMLLQRTAQRGIGLVVQSRRAVIQNQNIGQAATAREISRRCF